MKNLIIFFGIFMSLFVFEVQGQTEKGTIMLGVSYGFNLGGVSYSSSKIDRVFGEEGNEKRLNLNLSPNFGYFVCDNLVLGINSIISYSRTISENDYKQIQQSYSLGPFARYYLLNKSILPFAQISGAYGKGFYKSKSEDPTFSDNTSENSSWNLGGGLGVAIPIGNKATFDVLASYTYSSFKSGNRPLKSAGSLINLSLGFNVFLGR